MENANPFAGFTILTGTEMFHLAYFGGYCITFWYLFSDDFTKTLDEAGLQLSDMVTLRPDI